MARIRSIKPTFWSDEKIGLLPREVRMTFLGLISALADDHGRLVGNARIVRGAVYPYDDDLSVADVEGHLAQLAAAGRIRRYRVNGDEFIQIVHWARHQRVDRPSASLLPPPPDLLDALDDDSSNDRRTIPTEGKGRERDRSGKDSPPDAREDSIAETQLAELCGEQYPVVQAFLDERPAQLRAAWAADLLKIVGPATGNLPEDLVRAVTDARLASPPVTNARTLRIFVTTCREERLRGSPPTGGLTLARSDAQRPSSGESSAEAAWQATIALIPRWHHREVKEADFDAMAPGMRAGIAAVGGFPRIVSTPDEKRVWLRKEFVAAFNAHTGPSARRDASEVRSA